MKNQKGFAPLLIIIIIGIAVGGGAYYVSKKQNTNVPVVDPIVTTDTEHVQLRDRANATTTPNTTPTSTKTSASQKETTTSIKTEVKTTGTPSSSGAQNAWELTSAQAELEKAYAALKAQGMDPSINLIIAMPNYDQVLEPGKPFIVVFSPIKGAVKYEISITKPSWVDKNRLLIDPENVTTLLKETTTNTIHTIIVPKTDSMYSSENSYQGEILHVKALDSQGNIVKNKITYGGQSFDAPAQDQQQIEILASPTHPELLKANNYVLEKSGGSITLSFGPLPAKYSKREVSLMCINGSSQSASIDGKNCDEKITLGTGPYTKKLLIGPNPFKDRETSIAVQVQYFDHSGTVRSQGVFDDSFISIKLRRQ
ncbi:MAG: hypothetical protein V4519_03775 [Patescibacteria group bacterium]